MKPILMRHVEAQNESFKAWKNGDPYIHNPWHFHPEYEIAYIHRGRGTLFVGDTMVDYGENEIILLGPNLPHEWRSQIKQEPDLYSESISAHFKHNFIGDSFYGQTEVTRLKDFLEKAKSGIKITDLETKTYIKEKLLILPETKGLKRIIKLLQILDKISESQGLNYLCKNRIPYTINYNSQDYRINKVNEFIMKNFQESIKVEDAAKQVNMTRTSFCRYFKQRTNKTFIHYLNEIRVGYACKLLLEEEMTIAQIAFESGFGNISNFNKQFKNIKNTTPTCYADEFFKNNKASH